MADTKISNLNTTSTLESTDKFPIYNSATASTMAIAYSDILTELGTDITSFNSANIADGSVSNTEFQYLNGVTSAIQTQLDAKASLTGTETLTNKTLTSPTINLPLIQLTSQTVGGSDGNAVYLSGSSTWSAADASAEATASNGLGIRISASIVLTYGIYTTTGLTAGSIYYLSETTGAITTTAPSTSLSIVRVIGYALSTTQLFVCPDPTWVEVA